MFIEHLVMPLKPVLVSVSVLEPVPPVSGEKQASSDLGTRVHHRTHTLTPVNLKCMFLNSGRLLE